MRVALTVFLMAMGLAACQANGPIQDGPRPDPAAVSLDERRGWMYVELENGRRCKARIPPMAEERGSGRLQRCPDGYLWQIEREGPRWARLMASALVAATHFLGSPKPGIGAGKVTITTNDGAVTVFHVSYDEDGEGNYALAEQRPAPGRGL